MIKQELYFSVHRENDSFILCLCNTENQDKTILHTETLTATKTKEECLNNIDFLIHINEEKMCSRPCDLSLLNEEEREYFHINKNLIKGPKNIEIRLTRMCESSGNERYFTCLCNDNSDYYSDVSFHHWESKKTSTDIGLKQSVAVLKSLSKTTIIPLDKIHLDIPNDQAKALQEFLL